MLLNGAPAGPAPARPEVALDDLTLAAPPFDAHKVPRKEAAYFSEHFNQQLAAHGVQVISPQQVTSVREMEKLRQLVGCPETSADCIIELGHVLGAQGVLRGTLGKVGDSFLVDVRVYQASDGKVISAKSATARTGEALVRALDTLAEETAREVKAAFAPPKPKTSPPEEIKTTTVLPLPPPPPPPKPKPKPIPPRPFDWRVLSWVPAVAGAAAGGASAYYLADAEGHRATLRGGTQTMEDALRIRTEGERSAAIGTGLAVGAGAALAGAAALFLFGHPAGVTVTPAPSGVKVEVKLP